MKPLLRATLRRTCGPILPALAIGLSLAAPGQAADRGGGINPANLDATMRSLGFLETLPRAPQLVIGVVYVPGRESAAQTVAQHLAALPGPHAASVQAVTIPVGTLAGYAAPLHALFLMPGVAGHAETVVGVLRQRHIASISDDPDCLVSACCVLLVRGGPRIEIVLDTALMEAAGVRFSTVFTLMVQRK